MLRLVTSPTPCFALLRPATLSLVIPCLQVHYPGVPYLRIRTMSCLADPATVLASVNGGQGHSTSLCLHMPSICQFPCFPYLIKKSNTQALWCSFPCRQTAKTASYFLINKCAAEWFELKSDPDGSFPAAVLPCIGISSNISHHMSARFERLFFGQGSLYDLPLAWL